MQFRLIFTLATLAVAAAAFCGAVRAAEPPYSTAPASSRQSEPPQISAANDDAVAHLREAIGREEIARHLTVDEFLRRTGASDEPLLRMLRRCQPVGGPRWLDEQTCQVELEISGPRVGKVLVAIASSNPQTSPIAPDVLARIVAGWKGRTFGSFGSSTSARPVELRPRPANTEWCTVSDEARQRVVAAARADAVERVLASVRSLEMADHQLVGDALLIPDVDKRMTDWLSNRPVTRVEFGRDMEVEMDLSATPEETFAEFRAAVTAAHMGKALALPVSEAEWARFRKEWVTRMALPMGRAVLAANAVHPATRTAIPGRVPDWVGPSLIVDGIAPTQHNKLLSARAAEAAARTGLLSKIESLPLSPNVTVGQACEHNPRLRDAISRLIADAPIDRTLYGTLGRETTVRVELDSHDLWDAIEGN